nr:MAG TPA: hypothetical protein [Caudoviricetes sp.]
MHSDFAIPNLLLFEIYYNVLHQYGETCITFCAGTIYWHRGNKYIAIYPPMINHIFINLHIYIFIDIN